VPGCAVEVLIPDFKGDGAALEVVMAARPDILNHNTETVPRLYRTVRPGARFERSLDVLRRAKAAGLVAKSGIMVGLGETDEEILGVMRDMRAHGIDMLTIGQYLAPTTSHLPVRRYVHPDTFKMFEAQALEMGFSHAAVGAMVRSSYHADQQAHAAGVAIG
jgi:lipoic acid synthetase